MKTHLQLNIEFETNIPGWSVETVFNAVAEEIAARAAQDNVKIVSMSYNAFGERTLVKPAKRKKK